MSARNTIFAMLKGIAYIGIVLIHSKFPEPLGTGFQAIARLGAISKSIDCGYPIPLKRDKIQLSTVSELNGTTI